MSSTLCIDPECYSFINRCSDTLILYRCDKCKDKRVFATENELRCMAAAAAIELKNDINFKKYNIIELDHFPELCTYITRMMRHPKTTMLMQSIFGS